MMQVFDTRTDAADAVNVGVLNDGALFLVDGMPHIVMGLVGVPAIRSLCLTDGKVRWLRTTDMVVPVHCEVFLTD